MEKIVLPLSNGVGIYDKGRLCVSTINYHGDKRVEGVVIKENKKILDKPFLRGFVYFFYGFYLYIKCLILQLDDKEGNKTTKTTEKLGFYSDYIMVIACLVIAFLLGFLLLGILPRFILNRLFYDTSYYFNSFMIALFRVGIVYCVFVILKFIILFL